MINPVIQYFKSWFVRDESRLENLINARFKELENRMSNQSDALAAAQKVTNDNLAALTTAVGNLPKPDDLTQAIANETATGNAIAALTASLTTAPVAASA